MANQKKKFFQQDGAVYCRIYIEGKRIRKKLIDLDQLQRDARGRKRSESQQNSLLENLFLAVEKEIARSQQALHQQQVKERVAKIGQLFLRDVELRGRSSKTVTEYASALNDFIQYCGDISLDDYRLHHGHNLLRGLTERELAPRTQQKICIALNTFFKWCLEQEYSSKLIKLPMPTVVKRQPRPHSQQSIEEFGKYLHQRFDEATSESKRKFLLNHLRAYYLLRYAGLRRGEVHSLRLDNINLDKGVIHLRHVKEIGFKVKSGTEQTVPLAKVLIDEFLRDDLEERRAKERWYLDNGNGDLMPASANALTKALTRHAAQAGIEFQGKILHGFRASLATSLANENPAVAQRILRHANISTTISHYVNLPEATSRNLLDQVSQSSSTDSQLTVN